MTSRRCRARLPAALPKIASFNISPKGYQKVAGGRSEAETTGRAPAFVGTQKGCQVVLGQPFGLRIKTGLDATRAGSVVHFLFRGRFGSTCDRLSHNRLFQIL